MTNHVQTPPAHQRKLAGNLGVLPIVFMVVAAAAPLSVVAAQIPLGMTLGNGVGFAALFLFPTLVLVIFSVGFTAMARHIPKPGGFFTFVSYGLGRGPGISSALLAMLVYFLMVVNVHAFFGYLVSNLITNLTTVEIPWWPGAIVSITATALIGHRNVDVAGKALSVILVAEVAIILALVTVVAVTGGSDEGLSMAPFEPTHVFNGALGVGLVFAFAAFIGFESTVIYRDEAKNPEKTIPRATYTAVVGVGLFYLIAAWGLVMAWGPSSVMDHVAIDPGTFTLRTIELYLGHTGFVLVEALLIFSVFACGISFHNALSRYVYSLARMSIVHQRLGSVHPRHRSPYLSSLTMTLVAAIMVAVFAIFGLDPFLTILAWGGGVAILALLVVMVLTSAAVMVYFSRNSVDRNPWRTVIAPGISFIGLIASLALIVYYFPLQIGDVDATGEPAFGVLTWSMFALVVVVGLMGFVMSAVLKRNRPDVYQRMIEDGDDEPSSESEGAKATPTA
jgi:amino acid transporter